MCYQIPHKQVSTLHAVPIVLKNDTFINCSDLYRSAFILSSSKFFLIHLVDYSMEVSTLLEMTLFLLINSLTMKGILKIFK